MDQDAPAKPREQKVPGQRTRWKTLLLILSLLHGSSMTPPPRQPHSRGLQAGSAPSRTHLFTMETHTASTPPCYWKNSLTDANALRGPRLVSGKAGGAVTIHCHYAPSSVNRHQRKYWCRLGPPLQICYTIVSTNHYTHRDYRGRVTLTDFPRSGLFTVKLLQLSLNDTGLYRCGIGDRNDMLFFRMDLIVAAGPSNTTYAATSTSGELITASPGIAEAANRWTPGVTQTLEGGGSERDRTAPTTTNRWTPGVTQTLEGGGSERDRKAPTTTNRWIPGVTQTLEGGDPERDRTAPTTTNRWTPGVTQTLEGGDSEGDRTTANRWTLGVTQTLEGQGSEQDRTDLTTRISKTTASANGRQIPRTAKTTVPETSSREEGSIKATVPTPESPTSKARSVYRTTQGVWTRDTRSSAVTRASTSDGGEKGTTPEADGPQEEAEVNTSPEALRKTTGTTRPSTLVSERVTWETLQDAREASKPGTLCSVEESSPAPNTWMLNTTHMQMASGSTDWSLENTGGESSPQTPSQLSSGGAMTPGKESSMKRAFTEGESNPWILTPVSTLLPLVLLATLVLLKRRLWRERTSQRAERPPRITLIQMTHFLPDEQPAVGKNLHQDDLPPAPAGLSVLEKDPEP